MKELVKEKISTATKKAGFSVPQNFGLENPPKSEMGDFATNIAMMIAGRDKNRSTKLTAGNHSTKLMTGGPREIAERITSVLKADKDLPRVEIAGPGFINIFVKEDLFYQELRNILELKEDYGRGEKKKTKVQVEYVSANPTGPLHVGNARGGPIGEALAKLFEFLGYRVGREFYVNDMGVQINRFAESLYYWFEVRADKKLAFPEGGYPGGYIKEISELIQKEKKEELSKLKDKDDLLQFFAKEGLRHTIKSIREDCELIGIKFDRWVDQSDFQSSGQTELLLKKLEELGLTAKKEGALWFRSPTDPDLSDRESVLKKSDVAGSTTYFADDITYHVDKYERGFKKVIDIWGANHTGHVPRLKAAVRALGYSDDQLEIVLYQYVRLKNAGKIVSMGKRLGNFVTLRQVIESGVEPDAFKYFVLSQNANTPFDFDLKQAADTSEKNPVYYIKYAHARICSILAKVGESKVSKSEGADLRHLKNEKELALYKELIKFPELLNDTSSDFQIQALPHFAYKIAGLFHDFYANCQVIGPDKKLTAARLSLTLATKYVLANALNICGIEAPEHM